MKGDAMGKKHVQKDLLKYRDGIDDELRADDFTRFSDDQLSGICKYIVFSEEANKDNLLRMDLDDAAEQFIHEHYAEQASQPAAIELELRRISKATDRFASLLRGANESIALGTALQFGLARKGKSLNGKMPDLLKQLDLLKEVADECAGICKRAKKGGAQKGRNNRSTALVELMKALNRIWSTLSDEEFDQNNFHYFSAEVLRAIKESLSASVCQSDPLIIDALDRNYEAIRLLWDRIECKPC